MIHIRVPSDRRAKLNSNGPVCEVLVVPVVIFCALKDKRRYERIGDKERRALMAFEPRRGGSGVRSRSIIPNPDPVPTCHRDFHPPPGVWVTIIGLSRSKILEMFSAMSGIRG